MLVLGRAELESLRADVGRGRRRARGRLPSEGGRASSRTRRSPPFVRVRTHSSTRCPPISPGATVVGIKWVAGYEQNRAKGLPYIYGVFVLTDADSGRPLALVDGAWITEMRTAGVSGVVMRHLSDESPPPCDRGCGSAGTSSPGAAARSATGHRAGARVRRRAGGIRGPARACGRPRRECVARSAEQALEGADLVVTVVTVAIEPRLDRGEHPPGRRAPARRLRRRPRERGGERGDPLRGRRAGSVRVGRRTALVGVPRARRRARGRRRRPLAVPARGRRVFLNMGIAMDDVALGALCYDRAIERGIGRTIEFP